jgi:hypothetical protein
LQNCVVLNRLLRHPFVSIGLVLAVGGLVWGISQRIALYYHVPGPIEGNQFGFCDFHNGIYWPAVALAERISPYGAEFAEKFPVERSTPFYWPTTFWLHAPLASLELPAAEAVYFWVMLGLYCVLGLIALRAAEIKYSVGWLAALVCLMLASRSGYGTLFSGYFTLELAVGTLLALHWGNRPVRGGLMFALAASKPTYGIPLAVVLLARGQWRAVVWGGAFCIALGAAFYAWMLPGKNWNFWLEDVRFGQAQHMADPNEVPELSWTRVDLPGLIAKWLQVDPSETSQLIVFFLLCPLPVWLIWRLRHDPESQTLGSVSTALSLLMMNVLLYRHFYDLIVLIVPLVVLACGERASVGRLPQWLRYGVVGCILVAMFNYGSTLSFFERFDIERQSQAFFWLTSLSGLAMTLALVLAMGLARARLRVLGQASEKAAS